MHEKNVYYIKKKKNAKPVCFANARYVMRNIGLCTGAKTQVKSS